MFGIAVWLVAICLALVHLRRRGARFELVLFGFHKFMFEALEMATGAIFIFGVLMILVAPGSLQDESTIYLAAWLGGASIVLWGLTGFYRDAMPLYREGTSTSKVTPTAVQPQSVSDTLDDQIETMKRSLRRARGGGARYLILRKYESSIREWARKRNLTESQARQQLVNDARRQTS